MGDTAFLAIDVSNSEIVLGVYEHRVLRHHWRLQTDSGRTADEYGVLVRSLLGGVDHAPIGGAAVASVVPPMAPVIDLLCRQYLGVTPLVVGPGVRSGMPILYDKPQEVGADRIVNAIAAYERTRRTTIVVDFSTRRRCSTTCRRRASTSAASSRRGSASPAMPCSIVPPSSTASNW